MARPTHVAESDPAMKRYGRPAAKPQPPSAPVPSSKPPTTKRPPFQFSLTILLVLMAVFSLASAPAYYLMRAEEGAAGMQLGGMIVLLTGPMFLAIIVSLLLAAAGRWNNR